MVRLPVDVAHSGEWAYVGAGGEPAEEIGGMRMSGRRPTRCGTASTASSQIAADSSSRSITAWARGIDNPAGSRAARSELVDARFALPRHHLERRGAMLVRARTGTAGTEPRTARPSRRRRTARRRCPAECACRGPRSDRPLSRHRGHRWRPPRCDDGSSTLDRRPGFRRPSRPARSSLTSAGPSTDRSCMAAPNWESGFPCCDGKVTL